MSREGCADRAEVPPGPDGGPRPTRTHPLTPLVRGVQFGPAGFGMGLAWVGSAASESPAVVAVGVAAGVMFAVAAAAVGWLVWSRFTYWFDSDGDLRVASGILQRRERRLQVSRLQSVDLTQPLLARPFGLASLKVEVAGAGESHVRIEYLRLPEAEALRSAILRRSESADSSDGALVPEPATLARVDDSELVLSLLLRTSTAALVVLSVVILGGTAISSGFSAVPLAVVSGGVPVVSVVLDYAKFHGFTISGASDVLLIRRGLGTTVLDTVPVGRIHAVGFTESWLWRRMGWVRVELDVAGASGGDDRLGTTMLLPVTSWSVALDLVSLVLPGFDLSNAALDPVPRRARWRAPLQWAHLGLADDESFAIGRRGRITRRLVVVPHGRIQSVRVSRGPLQRALRLASLHLDLVPGPVRFLVPHMDDVRARTAAGRLADRAVLARRTESSGGRGRPDASRGPGDG